MSAKSHKSNNRTAKALSAGGAVIMSMANPINLLFAILLVIAGFALFNEQILLVGFISTLALLTAAIAAGLLAMFFVGSNKTLSSRGFAIFIVMALIVPVAIWSFEIFNTVSANQWLYVIELAAIMLICALYLVPRLRDVFRAKGVMADG